MNSLILSTNFAHPNIFSAIRTKNGFFSRPDQKWLFQPYFLFFTLFRGIIFLRVIRKLSKQILSQNCLTPKIDFRQHFKFRRISLTDSLIFQFFLHRVVTCPWCLTDEFINFVHKLSGHFVGPFKHFFGRPDQKMPFSAVFSNFSLFFVA